MPVDCQTNSVHGSALEDFKSRAQTHSPQLIELVEEQGGDKGQVERAEVEQENARLAQDVVQVDAAYPWRGAVWQLCSTSVEGLKSKISGRTFAMILWTSDCIMRSSVVTAGSLPFLVSV